MSIKLDDIIPNRFQPREVFDEEALEKLAESIRQHGVIEPIIVRPVSNKYEIVAGERRYKASVLAGLTKIPAIVKQMDDKEASIVAFIENEHREDVSAIEEARTINRILKNNNMTQEELANELGIKQSTISNKLRLLNLPLEVQEALMRNEISERHARSLLTVKNENKQIELLNKIKEKRMSVRELDSEIKNMNNMYDNNQMNNYNGASDDFMNSYMNNVPSGNEPKPTDDGFMNFLNNYDNNNPVNDAPQSMGPSPMDQYSMPGNMGATSPTPATDEGFMNYLNNYDVNNPVPANEPSVTTPAADEGFMNFLNNYDNNNPVPAPEVPQSMGPSPMNQYSMPGNMGTTSPTPAADEGFMDYLNNYDVNNPVPAPEVPQNMGPVPSAPTNAGYNDYMNNNEPISYDPLNVTPVIQNTGTMTQPAPNMGAMNYTPDYSNNDGVLNTAPAFDENIYNNFNNTISNNLNQPETMGVNDYVENNPNYVDVSKQVEISDVDGIINRLKDVVDEIKATSKYKIDTDEINYDDIYQITIKIDKRDF